MDTQITTVHDEKQQPRQDLKLVDSLRDSIDKNSLEEGSGGGFEDDGHIPKFIADQRDNPNYVHDLVYTEEEEKRVIRVIDTRLFPMLLLTIFVLNMDRTNNSNAISDNLPSDLGFTINLVNTATTCYSVLFSIFTLTGAIVAKKVGPSNLIPFLMLAWGTVTCSVAAIKNGTGYIAIRCFIAMTEGGVIPATLVYLSSFYKSTELGTRLAWFWGVQSIASAVDGILASGILQLQGVGGLYGWKWLFIIDGIFTILVAICTWFYLPVNAAKTKGGLRGFKPWFTDREVQIAVTRVIRDDPNKRHYETTVTMADIKDTFTDFSMWAHWWITAIQLTPLSPLSTYLPTVIKSFNFNVYVANALTAPPFILGCIFSVTNIWHSDRVGERGLHGAFAALWMLTGWFLLRFLPESTPRGVKYMAACITQAWPHSHPLNIAWMTQNAGTIGKKTIASGMIIGAANIYGVWGSQIYQAKDSPLFRTGDTICIAFAGTALFMWLGLKVYYINKNKKNARIVAAMSEKERAQAEEDRVRLGNRSPLFVFKH